MTYNGVLEPLLASLEHTAPSGMGRLAGQRIVTPRKDLTVLIAVDAERNVHFLLAPAPQSDARFGRFHLKALTIAKREWAVGGQPTSAYLDLTCTGGTEAAYRRPFLSFCEDLLVDLDRPDVSPDEATFRTCSRWQRFWTTDESGPVSVEWSRGLLGELLFLEHLIEEVGPRSVNAWTGPEAQDHDFQALSRVAFEVKVSATVPYTIECNLNQLDTTLFDELYLVVFQAVRVDDGESIVDVVSRIEAALTEEETALDTFYARLHATGYRRQRRVDYSAFRFTVDGPNYYLVGNDFPRITAATFRPPLDARIRGVRYMLQLVDVRKTPENDAGLRSAATKLG